MHANNLRAFPLQKHLKWVREVPLRVHDPRKVKMFHILYALPASWCDLLNSDGHSSDGGAPAFDNAVVEVCSSHPCAINGFISRTVLGFFTGLFIGFLRTVWNRRWVQCSQLRWDFTELCVSLKTSSGFKSLVMLGQYTRGNDDVLTSS